jgi:hypothetical protein
MAASILKQTTSVVNANSAGLGPHFVPETGNRLRYDELEASSSEPIRVTRRSA